MTLTQTPSPRASQPFNQLASFLDQGDEPLGFEAGDANLYRYVGNSPTMYTDPVGLDPVLGGNGYGGPGHTISDEAMQHGIGQPGGVGIPRPVSPSGGQDDGPVLGVLPPSGRPLPGGGNGLDTGKGLDKE